jgi:hypothetical protein
MWPIITKEHNRTTVHPTNWMNEVSDRQSYYLLMSLRSDSRVVYLTRFAQTAAALYLTHFAQTAAALYLTRFAQTAAALTPCGPVISV